jgi:hypothetical protein
MSFKDTSDVRFFVFKYYLMLEDGTEVRKTTRFDNLLNGIKFCYSCFIKDTDMISKKISVFDKAAKRKIMSGSINEIYEAYLNSYDHGNTHIDNYMIDILQLLDQIKLDVYEYVRKNQTVKNIMGINTKHARQVLEKV